MSRRIVALWFPRLATDRLHRRSQPDSASPPLVTVAKVKSAMVLQAVDRQATSLGLRVGQPLANARAMLPSLEVVQTDETADAKLLTRIADWCDRFTPFVAFDGPRHLLLDVTGATHLFGGEQAMLDHIRAKLRAQGFALRAAMAGTAVAARALARYKDGAVIACGQEEHAIKPLPIEALNLGSATTDALRRAGLKTIGQVATRQRKELVVRLGAAMLEVLDEALGRSSKPITPRRPPPEYAQEKSFSEPIANEDFIRAELASLTLALAKIMERHGQGARRLEAAFFRTDGAVRHIAIETGAPTRDPAMIDRLFREKLAMIADPLDPGFGFDLIRLCAVRVESINSEISDLNTHAHEKAEISFLIDRLSARFGSHRVVVFKSNDTHIPEKTFTMMQAQTAFASKSEWKKPRIKTATPRRPLRMFARPEPIILATPTQLNWRKTNRIVTENEGPERIAMEWWRHEEAMPTRDYFRAEDEQGRRYWFYCNAATDQWFLQGLFA
jgi:protein ImuB